MSAQFTVGRVVLPALAAAAIAFAVPRQTFSQGATGAAAPANAGAGELEVLPVQNNVHAIFGAGGNITVQVGEQGPLLVDSGLAGASEKIVASRRPPPVVPPLMKPPPVESTLLPPM